MTLDLEAIRNQLGLVVANTPGTTVAKNTAYTLLAEVERLRGIVARVRELHPYEVIDLHESHGEEAWCPECQFHYPCQAIRALEGE